MEETEKRNVEEAIENVAQDVTDREPKFKDPCRARNDKERAEDIFKVVLFPRKEIAKFLRDRSISETLIETMLKVGFTDEFLRLLKAMGFSQEDISELEQLWAIEVKNRGATDSVRSSSVSSCDCLSPDGIYLSHGLSKPLRRALRDILAKKPSDPIEYLGHWLLNYKICQERRRRFKEFELELTIERERLKPKEEEDAEMPAEEGYEEEEEYFGDWDFPEPE